MANRRMFSKQITESDPFLDMPLSTQALYFHLGMNADDDGFVAPKKVMRMVGASNDELLVLLAKGFIIQFESGIILVSHWRENNFIRKDRYQKTFHAEELKAVTVDDTNTYRLWSTSGQPVVNQVTTSGEPTVDQRLTQGRVGKVRLGKESKNTSPKKTGYPEDFETFWKSYPRKVQKIAALTAWKKMKAMMPDVQEVVSKIEELKESDDWTKDSGQFIPYPATWLNKGGWETEVVKLNARLQEMIDAI